MLEEGLGKLKDYDNAPSSLRTLQANAQEKRLGLWKNLDDEASTGEGSSGLKQLATLWDKVCSWTELSIKFIRDQIIYLISIGLFGLLVDFVYRKNYIERKISLMLIGKESAGKTALLHRLLDRKMTEGDILKLSPTASDSTTKHSSFIAKGRFELYPEVTDIPGTAYGSVWNYLFRGKSHVAIIVVAPTKKNNPSGSSRDDSYLDIQLGYIQANIEGALGSNVIKRKPKSLILFINKFDLYSNYPPDDSQSSNHEKEIRAIFERHERSITSAAKRAGIPFHIIIGSALKGWKCNFIIDSASKDLIGV